MRQQQDVFFDNLLPQQQIKPQSKKSLNNGAISPIANAGKVDIITKMTRQLPDRPKDPDPTGNPYAQWEDWAEEAFPEEEPKIDRLKLSTFRHRRVQDRLESRHSKGTKAIPPREVPPVPAEILMEPEAEPGAEPDEMTEFARDVSLDAVQQIAEAGQGSDASPAGR